MSHKNKTGKGPPYIGSKKRHRKIHSFKTRIYQQQARCTPVRAATHCNTLKHNATHCNTLQNTATDRNTLKHTATHTCEIMLPKLHPNTCTRTALCSTLQHNATHCNTLQHTATHCNTLQYTATHTCEIMPPKLHPTTCTRTAPCSCARPDACVNNCGVLQCVAVCGKVLQ